ncbi:MAG: CpXC domain-containing protein [Anaerolineae bacterium]|jgi:hypothetical protein|nr:CpXC domain-containing protein [Anaerolineae bacterium]
MSQVVRTSINCPTCGQPVNAIIEQIIDVGRDPQAKARFLSGRINQITCPNCGNQITLGTPLLYHDPGKELLLVYVPMELQVTQQERENIIGGLTRRLTDSLPQEQRKGYLLRPQQPLTIPGMIDIILEADGITKEMRDAQRAKINTMNLFTHVSPDEWPALLEEHTDEIDAEFFQMLIAAAQNSAESGHQHMAERLFNLYNYLITNTEIGQQAIEAAQVHEAVAQEVAEDIESLGEDMTREDFMNLVLSYADDDNHVQALVAMMRPALDYTFFQELTGKIEQAKGKEQEKLAALRARLLELANVIDQQTHAVLQRAADTLRIILNSEDIDAAIRPRLAAIDDTFLAVLHANLHEAEQRQDLQTTARLKLVLEKTLAILREHAPPHLRLINDLMGAESDEEARELIETEAPQFGPELIDLMNAVADDLDDSDRPDEADRLRVFSDYAAEFVLGPGE